MALIPGTLPNDTCYGTPQDLLELFAQYLDVPAFALNSKVVFSTTNTGFTSDIVWFDTSSATRPIMKITVSSSGFLDYVKNYITAAPVVTIVGADTVLILDASDSGNTKRGLVSDISVPAAGSVTYTMLSGTSGTEANNVASRTAKAWVNFDGTTNVAGNCTIRADFNVSTVADNGTGDYTINFSSNMSGTNYCIAIGVASQSFPSTPEAGTTKTISSCSIKTVTVQSIGGDNKTVADNSSVHAVIFE
jgi:hypothetical protein